MMDLESDDNASAQASESASESERSNESINLATISSDKQELTITIKERKKAHERKCRLRASAWIGMAEDQEPNADDMDGQKNNTEEAGDSCSNSSSITSSSSIVTTTESDVKSKVDCIRCDTASAKDEEIIQEVRVVEGGCTVFAEEIAVLEEAAAAASSIDDLDYYWGSKGTGPAAAISRSISEGREENQGHQGRQLFESVSDCTNNSSVVDGSSCIGTGSSFSVGSSLRADYYYNKHANEELPPFFDNIDDIDSTQEEEDRPSHSGAYIDESTTRSGLTTFSRPQATLGEPGQRQRMRRFRQLKNGGGDEDDQGWQRGKDKGKGKARDGGAEGGFEIGFSFPKSSSSSSSLSLLGGGNGKKLGKLPRPRSWVNSLINATTPSSSSRDLSTLAQPSTPRLRKLRNHSEAALPLPMYRSPAMIDSAPPVSSLVLQDEFARPSSSSASGSSTSNTGTRANGAMERKPTMNARARMAQLRAQQNGGTMGAAARSAPELPLSGREGEYEDEEDDEEEEEEETPAPAPFLRSLDDAPRGTFTPSSMDMAMVKNTRKMTNPWAKLLGPDEEQVLTNNAVDEARREGGDMANEERAVLAMLDAMNGQVDTFALARAKTVIERTSSQDRPTSSSTQAEQLPLNRTKSLGAAAAAAAGTSPTRPSVKAFASAFEQGSGNREEEDDIVSRVRSQFLRRTATTGETSNSSVSSVRKAIEQREELDKKSSASAAPSLAPMSISQAGSLLSAVSSSLKAKTSMASLRFGPSAAPVTTAVPAATTPSSPTKEESKSTSQIGNEDDEDEEAIVAPVRGPGANGSSFNRSRSRSIRSKSRSDLRSSSVDSSTSSGSSSESRSRMSSSPTPRRIRPVRTESEPFASPSLTRQHTTANSTSNFSSSQIDSGFGSRRQMRNGATPSQALSRRPTQLAILSPHASSHVSSSAPGTSTSFWSRLPPNSSNYGNSRGMRSPTMTSPGMTSAEEDDKGGFSSQQDWMRRRRMPTFTRQATDATSLSMAEMDGGGDKEQQVEESQSVKSKRSQHGGGEEDEAMVRSATSSVSSASKENNDEAEVESILSASDAPPPSLPSKSEVSFANGALLPLADEAFLARATPAMASSAEVGVSPALLGTPTRAKDLIRFFEQHSSPQLPSRSQSPSPKKQVQARTALLLATAAGNCNDSNSNIGINTPPRLTYRDPRATELTESYADASLEKAAMAQRRLGAGRRRRAPLAIGAGGGGGGGDLSGGGGDFDDDEDAGMEDAENDPFAALDAQATPRRASRNNIGTPPASASRKTSAANTPIKTTAMMAASAFSSSGGGKAAGGPNAYNYGNNANQRSTSQQQQQQSSQQQQQGQTGNSPPKKGPMWKSSVRSIVNALSGSGSGIVIGGASNAPPPPTSYREPKKVAERSTAPTTPGEETDENRSTLSMGTLASFRRRSETGAGLRLDPRKATVDMLAEERGAYPAEDPAIPEYVEPLRVGFVYYFNVHTRQPHWQRAQAVLLPAALALSWIPAGGGRENVVLDLYACREVHSVPHAEHPSSVADMGARLARDQGLGHLSPFQLLFDDGVERLAVETARDRVQWVSAVWDALGSSMARRGSVGARAAASALAAGSVPATPQEEQPAPQMLPQTNDQQRDMDRIGAVWRSELSSQEAHSSSPRQEPAVIARDTLAEALGTGPPVPPKEPKDQQQRKKTASAAAAAIQRKASTAARPPPSLVATDEQVQRIQSVPVSVDDGAASQETLVSEVSNRNGAREQDEDKSDIDHDDDFDFGPRTPRSEAVFAWRTQDPDRDIHPSDSASQRPARSERGNSISSRVQAPSKKRSEPATASSSMEEVAGPAQLLVPEAADAMPRTPAQTLRDSIMGQVAEGSPLAVAEDLLAEQQLQLQPIGQLDTVVEETLSQAAAQSSSLLQPVGGSSTRRRSTTRSSLNPPVSPLTGMAAGGLVAAASATVSPASARLPLEPVEERVATPESVAEEKAAAPTNATRNASKRSTETATKAAAGTSMASRARSILSSFSQHSNGAASSISSDDVNRLLEYLEVQQAERRDRDAMMASQFANFQQALETLQRQATAAVVDSPTPSAMSSPSRNPSQMQSPSASSSVSRRSKRSTATGADRSELRAVKEKLDRLVLLMGQQASMQQTSQAEAGLPAMLRAANRVRDGDQEPTNGRDRAILADRLVYGTRPMERRMSAPPSMEDEDNGEDSNDEADYSTPMARIGSADDIDVPAADDNAVTPTMQTTPRMGGAMFRRSPHLPSSSASDSDIVSSLMAERIPPRSWVSRDGIPGAPANTDRGHGEEDTASLFTLSNVDLDNDHYAGIDLLAARRASSTVMSLDMEAEIRRRRMAQTRGVRAANTPYADGGGWYTGRPGPLESGAPTPLLPGHQQQPRRPQGQAAGNRLRTVSQQTADEVVGALPWAGKIKPQQDKGKARATTNGAADGLGLSVIGETPRPNPFASPAMSDATVDRNAGQTTGGGGVASSQIDAVLEAIRDNEQARQAQHKQQADIARYLNELNAWLERDVVDRSKEWRTLAMGVTQLHDELAVLKGGGAPPPPAAGAGPAAVPAPFAMPASYNPGMAGPSFGGGDGAMPDMPAPAPFAAAGGPSGPRAMDAAGMAAPLSPGMAVPPTPLRPASGAAPPTAGPPPGMDTGLGFLAPAPIVTPGPAASGGGTATRRAGTRTWRADASPGPLRNDDVWRGSGSTRRAAKDKKEAKEAEKREKKRNMQEGAGRLAIAAGGAALVAAAVHEFDKYREKKRKKQQENGNRAVEKEKGQGEQQRSLEMDFSLLDAIKRAARSGDERQVREAVRAAADKGDGQAAVEKIVEEIRAAGQPETETETELNDADEDEETQVGAEDAAEPMQREKSNDSEPTAVNVEEDYATTRAQTPSTAKSPSRAERSKRASTFASDATTMATMASAGAGGGALALAVEEILKHLLERKEEEARQAREREMEEAARKAREAQREQQSMSTREREKAELVDMILARLDGEKARQAAEEERKRREMDPKSAIESLVSALNAQRQADAASKSTQDAAMQSMTAQLLKATSEQNGQLVTAVHAAGREMLRNNIEAHADELKRLLSREVTGMFEDVGKIREAKRHLEHEISDLFSIKARHLVHLDQQPAAIGVGSLQPQQHYIHQQMPPPTQDGGAAQDRSTLRAVKDLLTGGNGGPPPQQDPPPAVGTLQQPVQNWAQPMSVLQQQPPPMPGIMGMGMMQPPPAIPPTQGIGVGSPVLGEVKGIPQILTTALPKRDFIGPFSINFGAKK